MHKQLQYFPTTIPLFPKIQLPMKAKWHFNLILFLFAFNPAFCQLEDYRLWITKMSGGNGYGKISSINPDGSNYDHGVVFEGALDGRRPIREILQGSDGYLYGATEAGGLSDWGVIYKMNADGSSYSVLHNFTKKEGANPSGALVEASDGKLYGVSRGIEGFPPVVFSIDKLTGTFELIYEFTIEPNGLYPISLLPASNGYLYGVCERGNSGGAIFRIDLSTHEFQKLVDLTSLYPGKLLQGSDGLLYGTLGQASQSSVAGASIYRINLDGSGFTTIFEFSAIGTSNPARQLIEGSDGYLYGTTSPGTANGLIYKVKKDGSDFAVLHNFSFEDGYSPQYGVVSGTDGLLYGFTTLGAAFGRGAFYRISSDGLNFEILKSFETDFETISSASTQIPDGNLYVTSMSGGINGVIHKFSPGGQHWKVKDFPEAVDHPYQLFYAKSNDLYGISRSGGGKGLGGIFKLEQDGSNMLTVVYENNLTDKAIFQENLAEDNDGNFYAYVGGFGNAIGKLSPDLSFTKIYQFPDNTFTWAARGALAFASDGFLYGISAGGGTHGKGTLYRLRTDGSEFSIVHSFEESTLARQPVQFESDGYLYGVCNGGVHGKGSIYRFNITTKEFERIFDLTAYFGSTSFGFFKLVKGSDDLIYALGTTGGASGHGLLVRMALDGSAFQELRSFSFNSSTEGYLPTRIVEGPDSNLYGITAQGGDHNAGVIFSMKRDGSDYHKVFDLPEELDLRFLAEVDMNIIPKIPHEISFTLPSDTLKVTDEPVTLTASSDAGLPITFLSSDESIAKVEGTTLMILGVGKVSITAEQVGNHFYTRAAESQTLHIEKGDQSVTLDTIKTKSVSDNYFDLPATSSSGLPVSYSTPSNNITIAGTRVTILSAGRATIIAHQEGDVNFNAAFLEHSFCINPAKPSISVDRLTSNTLVLSSSSDAANQWYFNGAEISGATQKTLTIVEDGVYTVKTMVDDCFSELSDGYASIVTGLETPAECNVAIYPNPAGEQLSVEVTGNSGWISVDIIDVMGRTLISQVGNRKEILDLHYAPSGVYFVQIRIDDKLYIKQILKR